MTKILIDRSVVEQAVWALEGFVHHGKAPWWPTALPALRAALEQHQEPEAGGVCGRCGAWAVDPVLPDEQRQESIQAPCFVATDGVCEALDCCQRQEPVQEPVAWMFQHDETGRMNYVSNDGMNTPFEFVKMNPRYALVCALYTHPAPQPVEPVGTVKDLFSQTAWERLDVVGSTKVYFGTPAPQPVELTDEEIADIAKETETAEPGRDGYILPHSFARAVIAAYQKKQEGKV
jgi:hypothetical protein